eukprot:g48820.t1
MKDRHCANWVSECFCVSAELTITTSFQNSNPDNQKMHQKTVSASVQNGPPRYFRRESTCYNSSFCGSTLQQLHSERKSMLCLLAWSTAVFGSHLVQAPLDECVAFNRPLRIGIQYEESADFATALWNATLSAYLTDFLRPFGCQGARLAAVLQHEELYSRVGQQLAGNLAQSEWLDMLLLSPALLTGLHQLHDEAVPTLTTVRRVHQGTVSERLAGVLVRLKNENTFLVDWADLIDPAAQQLKLCAVSRDSFSGFQIQDFEALERLGVHLEDVFNVSFVHSHDQVLADVWSGKCAVGAVGAGHVERVANTGLVHSPYSVLALDLWAAVGQVSTDTLPVLHSTRLYPEWGVSALSGHVPARLVALVRMALLAIESHHPAAVQGKHAGFTFASDYHEVEMVEYHLDFYGDGRCPAKYERQAGGTRMCRLCPRGTFKANDQGMCEFCPVRYYSNVTGATSCMACPEGFTSFRDGSTECEPEDNTGYVPIKLCDNYLNNTLVVGVLTLVEKGLVHARWAPTFETALNRFLNKFGCATRMVELNWNEMTQAVAQRTIDFAFLDPGLYLRLEYQHGLRAECSVLRNVRGEVTGYMGGVLFRRADRNLDLHSLQDIRTASLSRSLRACPVDQDSFTGWAIQWYEFFKQQLDVFAVFDEIVFSGSHGESVAMVARGDCDVGMAATYTLEQLKAYSDHTFALINQRHHPHFHQLVSTDLYHEWAFAVLPHVEEEIWKRAIIPLLAMPEHHEAAIKGEHAGFTEFHSFEDNANVLLQLNLINKTADLCAPGSARNYTDPLKGCSKCGLGRFNDDGMPVCRACYPDFFGDEEGLIECKRCPPGTITHKFGETECMVEAEVLQYHPIEACNDFPNRTLVVGVLMEVEEQGVFERWQPTFEGELNGYFNRFQCYFSMVALGWHDLLAAIDNRLLDFVFLDSGAFTILERKFDARALATVVRFFAGRPNAKEGGVIFARNNTELADVVSSLEDLQRFSVSRPDLKLCAVDKESFTGYDIQKYEFFKRKMVLKQIFKETIFTGENELTVKMVMDGDCDVGMVRTGIMERLLHAGHHEIEHFHILNEQFHQGFALIVSTPLYNEWPFAALPHVDETIWSSVRIPLLGMREFDTAAVKGEYAGFVWAEDYSEEAEVDYQLNLIDPTTGVCAPGSARDYADVLEPCVKCGTGRFNHDGMPICHACDLGFFADEKGSVACKRCAPGFISHEFGADHCEEEAEVLAYQPIEECEGFTNSTLVVGVLTEVSKELTHKTWDPTFDTTLNEYFNRFQCRFKTIALDWHEVHEAVEAKSIDLLFADSGLYTKLNHQYGLKALASVMRDFQGFLAPKYGGVLFRNSSLNTDLNTLSDLERASGQRKLRACPVDADSFGGWHAQSYEFFKAEIDVRQVFDSIEFSESSDLAVELVATGLCDVGFVRTETLERLIHQGLYEVEHFAIINEKQFEGFVQLLSTDLYPEWPLAVLPHVPPEIAGVVAIPLLAMRESDYASKTASHAGFTATYSYESAAEVRYQLALEPDATCGTGSYRDLATKLKRCRPCPAGSFSAKGLGACSLCPLGYEAPEPRSSNCTPCAFGFSTLAAGGTACVAYSQQIEMNQAAVYAIWALCSLLFVFCMSIFALVVKHRKTKLMKASSASFNMVLIFACGVICAATVLFSLEPEPNNWVCSLRWWMPCLAASTVFGTLFSKTYRLYSIFSIYETKQKIPQAIKFKDTRVAGMVASFVTVTCVVLAIFFLVEPPFYQRLQLHLEGQDYYTYIEACYVSKVWVPLIFTCYTVLLCGQCWLACRVRNLPTIFNESKLIAWLLYNTVFVGLVGIMVDTMLDVTQVTAKLMVRAVALLLGACTPVAVLYGPKLLEIYMEEMNNSKYSSKDQTSTKTQEKYESQGGHTRVEPAAMSGDGVTKKGVKSIPVRMADHNKSTVGKSGKSHLSVCASAVSGYSDDEEEMGFDADMDIVLVPDSDVAGDEEFKAQFETVLKVKQQDRGVENRSSRMEVQDEANVKFKQDEVVEKRPSDCQLVSPSQSNMPVLKELESELPARTHSSSGNSRNTRVQLSPKLERDSACNEELGIASKAAVHKPLLKKSASSEDLGRAASVPTRKSISKEENTGNAPANLPALEELEESEAHKAAARAKETMLHTLRRASTSTSGTRSSVTDFIASEEVETVPSRGRPHGHGQASGAAASSHGHGQASGGATAGQALHHVHSLKLAAAYPIEPADDENV